MHLGEKSSKELFLATVIIKCKSEDKYKNKEKGSIEEIFLATVIIKCQCKFNNREKGCFMAIFRCPPGRPIFKRKRVKRLIINI